MPESPAPLLVLRNVVKRFGGVRALDGVDFELRCGEVHALLGENGAGKSTLIKVLGGIHIPESGSIEIDGRPAAIRCVADADRHGVRIIHQELSLAPNLSIAENIFLGREPHRFGWLRPKRMVADAESLIGRLGLAEIRAVRTPVADLSVAHAQLVEIARALSCQARILVLDEPTSSLSEAETEALFVTLRQLRASGVGIIYISHRLEEIMRLADRITVLRDGRSIGTQPTAAVDRRELVRWMVGRDLAPRVQAGTRRPGNVALEVRDLRNARVRGVSFKLHYGEVLGIAGLVGSGRSELARAIFGADRLQSGQVRVDDRPVTIRSPRDALQAGIVLVPEDRKLQGLVMGQSAAFNLALPWLREWISWKGPNAARRRAIIERAVRAFVIKVADPEQLIDILSGGNQQKILVGRWMERRPKILILDEPTRGIDVGARSELFQIVNRLAEEGMAVLLISSDLAEVLGESHRIALYRDGRILDVRPAGQFTPESIMHQLTGAATA